MSRVSPCASVRSEETLDKSAFLKTLINSSYPESFSFFCIYFLGIVLSSFLLLYQLLLPLYCTTSKSLETCKQKVKVDVHKLSNVQVNPHGICRVLDSVKQKLSLERI